MALTRAPSTSATPFSFRSASTKRITSSSKGASTLSSISTTVTGTPSFAYSVANSMPITPAPMMTTRFGQAVRFSMPVESTTPGRSTPGMGMRAGLEPVAITRWAQASSSPEASRTAPRPETTALSWNTVTPWFFSRNATPSRSRLETSLLFCTMAA